MSETPHVPRVVRVLTRDGAALAVFCYGADSSGMPQPAVASQPAGMSSVDSMVAQSCARLHDVPLLCLHGNGSSHRSFEAFAQTFASERLVIVPDMRDQGISERGSATPLTYDLFARDVIDVLDALGIERTCVLGSSDGGIEALLLARDYPERVAAILPMGANITTDGIAADDLTGMKQEEALYRSLQDIFPKAAREADLLRLMLDYPTIEAASLCAISCPATIMAGEFDIICEKETRAIYEHIPGARLVIAEGSGHALMRDAPELVEKELRQLFERV